MKNFLILGLAILPTFVLAETLPEDAKIACDSQGQECLAVGSSTLDCFNCSQPVTYLSHDGQKSWEMVQSIDLGISRVSIDSLTCSKELEHCFVKGGYFTGHENLDIRDQLILTSHDKGRFWIDQIFGFGRVSFSSAVIEHVFCTASFSHCVGIGFYNEGGEGLYPMAIYLEGNDPWQWGKGLENDALKIYFESLTCIEDNDQLTCEVHGKASDDGTKWWEVTAISEDKGHTWKYLDSRKKPYTFAKFNPQPPFLTQLQLKKVTKSH